MNALHLDMLKTRRLGKLPRRPDPRDLKLAHYLRPELLPPIPTYRDWGTKIGKSGWGMMSNSHYGDCTCAAVGHAVQAFTVNTTGTPFTASDAQVLALYSTVTGEEGAAFNAGPPPVNDNGCIIRDVLNEWRTNGFVGHQLGAYAYINPRRFDMIRAAIDLFGAVNIGIALPISAQTQFPVWTVTDPTLQGNAAPGSWGGHSVILTAYSPKTVTCVTWGLEMYITWAWLYYYCDEAWALLSPDWVSGNKPAPNGFNLAQLQEDLSEVTA